jgi:hypothetical protein
MMAVVFYPSLSVFPQDASIWTSSQEAAKRDIKRKKKKKNEGSRRDRNWHPFALDLQKQTRKRGGVDGTEGLVAGETAGMPMKHPRQLSQHGGCVVRWTNNR